jgi:hypothetical protein
MDAQVPRELPGLAGIVLMFCSLVFLVVRRPGYMYALHFVKRYTGRDIATALLAKLVPAALDYGKR